MNTAFIACEYNPFHNGHKFHIDSVRKAGFDTVICIMSGNFVQRGDIALFEKHRRAETALLNGADLVIELPLKYAVSTASLFADGFIKTAKATGLYGSISFGAKNSTEDLVFLEKYLFSKEAENYCNKKIREGINYPNAKREFIKETLGTGFAEILSDGNNTLALEYLRAKNLYFNDAGIHSVFRKGSDHDSSVTTECFASASYLRELIYKNGNKVPPSGLNALFGYIPENLHGTIKLLMDDGKFPRDTEKFETAMLSRLSMLSTEQFSEINNVTEGLENRIVEAIKISCSTSDILYNVKSKRFTYSRLRQILLNAAIGINKYDIERGISYLRVLGSNDRGRTMLRQMKESADLPVISNLSEINKDNPDALRDAFLDYQAGKLFSLCDPVCRAGNPEYEIPPVFINNTGL